jgi:GT2 family glycosyltransferase
MHEIPFFFSIIIPTYNRPAQLKTCLEAISYLDYPSDRFEVIVVDDGSQTLVETVVPPFREQFDLTLLTQPNSGPAVARNTGARRAKGKFLAFTDDDCAPAASWLKKLAARFATTSRHAIGGRTLNALRCNRYSTASQAIMDFVYEYYNADPNHARFFASNNMAVPADLFHAVGGFDEGWRLAASEDRELCDRWLYCGHEMIYAPEVVVYHAHALTARGFWRQHFNYGRGAFRFHQRRSRRGSGPFRPEFQFYIELLRYPFVKRNRQPTLWPILALWQLANTTGFLWEMAKGSWQRHFARAEKTAFSSS